MRDPQRNSLLITLSPKVLQRPSMVLVFGHIHIWSSSDTLLEAGFWSNFPQKFSEDPFWNPFLVKFSTKGPPVTSLNLILHFKDMTNKIPPIILNYCNSHKFTKRYQEQLPLIYTLKKHSMMTKGMTTIKRIKLK